MVNEKPNMAAQEQALFPSSNHNIQLNEPNRYVKKPIFVLRLLVVCIIAIVFLLLIVVVIIWTKRPEKETSQFCLKCSALSELIDRWAWKDDVTEQEDGECCFEDETSFFKSMKFFFEKQMSSGKREIDILRHRVDSLTYLMLDNKTGNATVMPPVDITRLMDLINQVFHKPRSIIHLVSSRMEHTSSGPMIKWESMTKQGNLSYNATRQSVVFHTTALYYITLHVKFEANITSSNQTENTTVQLYLKTFKQKYPNHPNNIESYKKFCIFHDKMAEHDAIIHTITQLESGEELFVDVPNSQNKYLSTKSGSHRLSIFELS